MKIEAFDGRRQSCCYGALTLKRKMTKVLPANFTTDYADLTDLTERIGGDFTHLLGEQIFLSNLFKISGSYLPF